MESATLDASLAATGSKATYAGAGASVGSWFLSSEFGVLCGILIAVAGLAVNVYFKRREDRRKQDEHDARMSTLGVP